MNCAVRAVLHREHSIWYSKEVCLSQPHNIAYKGERTERELGLMVVLTLSTLSDKQRVFLKYVFENKMCFILLNNFLMYLILGKDQ